jgi:hypothetical protein
VNAYKNAYKKFPISNNQKVAFGIYRVSTGSSGGLMDAYASAAAWMHTALSKGKIWPTKSDAYRIGTHAPFFNKEHHFYYYCLTMFKFERETNM